MKGVVVGMCRIVSLETQFVNGSMQNATNIFYYLLLRIQVVFADVLGK